MSALSPFQVLAATTKGDELPLPAELARLYGPCRLPLRPDRPYVMGNFVTTLDGVVSLNLPGQAGGGEISGFNQHDRMVMGLLRAAVGAVVVGAGTLRAVPRHIWSAGYVYPRLADAYRQLSCTLGYSEPPLNVIVTGRGDLDLSLPVFQSGEVPVLIVTTEQGADHLRQYQMPATVQVTIAAREGRVSASSVLDAIQRARQVNAILVEGGPQLMGDFFAEQRLDELFLTLAPQVAGRDASAERPGLVEGRIFAPDTPVWGELVEVRRAGEHLFLRYAFPSGRS